MQREQLEQLLLSSNSILRSTFLMLYLKEDNVEAFFHVTRNRTPYLWAHISIIQWSVTQDRFQPCRLTKGGFLHGYPHPQALKVRASRGVRWHAPLRIILRYVPLIIICHFLHFETMNECKPCTKVRQSSALACPKLLQARCLDKNGWETSEKWQRIMLKRLVKLRKEEF